jgi:uncharacterized phage infection (PIP) family protein YhgE
MAQLIKLYEAILADTSVSEEEMRKRLSEIAAQVINANNDIKKTCAELEAASEKTSLETQKCR